jgi:hypothetical protein
MQRKSHLKNYTKSLYMSGLCLRVRGRGSEIEKAWYTVYSVPLSLPPLHHILASMYMARMAVYRIRKQKYPVF